MVKGKVALVTGGGSGIGRATCQVLAREGARVVVADVNKTGAKETVVSLPGAGSRHMSLFMDVACNDSVEAGIVAIKERYQEPPTVCVNCAGVPLMSPFLDTTDEQYNKTMAVNIKGTMNTTKAVCRELLEAKLPGSIVNTASIAVKGFEGTTIYSASKGAVKSFSRSIAKEFGSHGIRCNIVCPGPIYTGMTKDVDESVIQQFVSAVTLKRIGQPEEVAEVNVFLASNKSSYMTGACMFVDGGF